MCVHPFSSMALRVLSDTVPASVENNVSGDPLTNSFVTCVTVNGVSVASPSAESAAAAAAAAAPLGATVSSSLSSSSSASSSSSSSSTRAAWPSSLPGAVSASLSPFFDFLSFLVAFVDSPFAVGTAAAAAAPTPGVVRGSSDEPSPSMCLFFPLSSDTVQTRVNTTTTLL